MVVTKQAWVSAAEMAVSLVMDISFSGSTDGLKQFLKSSIG